MTMTITDVAGIGPAAAKTLAGHKIKTVPDLATATVEELSEIPGFGGARGQKLIDAARALLAQGESAGTVADPAPADESGAQKKGKGKKKGNEKKKNKDKKDKKGGKGKKDKKRKGKG